MCAHVRSFVVSLGVMTVLFSWCSRAMGGGTATQRIYEGQFSLAIPADTSTSKGWMDDAVIDVPDHVTIEDLDVGVTLTHSSVFDLQLLLISPAGTTVLLNIYGLGDGYIPGADYDGTFFDDEALLSIQEGTAPFTGRFRPVESLTAFDGQDAYGPWHLRIYDFWYGDTGYLETFSLVVTVPTVPEPSAMALILSGLGSVGLWARRGLCCRRLPGLFG